MPKQEFSDVKWIISCSRSKTNPRYRTADKLKIANRLWLVGRGSYWRYRMLHEAEDHDEVCACWLCTWTACTVLTDEMLSQAEKALKISADRSKHPTGTLTIRLRRPRRTSLDWDLGFRVLSYTQSSEALVRDHQIVAKIKWKWKTSRRSSEELFSMTTELPSEPDWGHRPPIVYAPRAPN